MTGAAFGTLVGGIGLFLLGMSLMTDSLTALGGAALRRLLTRLGQRPSLGLLMGAVATATLQSSSATTLITVGFVSAGLLSFTDSLALIFGANLGTTSTAWIVALVGLKVKVSAVALPVVGVGALIRLLSRGRRARLGLALAGFGLIFIGIDVMQQGMAMVDLDLSQWSGARGFLGTLLLVGIGTVMTVVMQSSSAAIATTLVALDAGYMTIGQAAALVIGQNVGTTVTAVLGAAGGRLAARRAALAHTFFNIGTGLVALAILGPFVRIVEAIGHRFVSESPETAIAMFHTAFNALGVALFFPFRRQFARAVERLVPQRGSVALELPSTAVLQVPALALEAARRGAAKVAREALEVTVESLHRAARVGTSSWRDVLLLVADPRALLTGEDEPTRRLIARLRGLRAALDDLSEYLGRVRISGRAAQLREEQVALVHATENLRRLVAFVEDVELVEVVHGDAELRGLAAEVTEALADVPKALTEDPDALVLAAGKVHAVFAAHGRRAESHRQNTLARLAEGKLSTQEADQLLRAARWIGKLPRHAHRALLHLGWTAGAEMPVEADD